MNVPSRVLLVEHVDATGAAPSDARARAAACREAGAAVEVLVLDSRPGDDLQFSGPDAPAGTTIDVLPDDDDGRRRLAARVRASRADLVLWASASRGGGPHAAQVVAGRPARWWATGHAAPRAVEGALAPLDPGFAPIGGSAWDAERTPRGRLSLWDGPFVLVPAAPAPATARLVFAAFAAACRERDELDLVVLAHPRAELEAIARAAHAGLRVHFVGPAPREAEHAWLATARAAVVSGDEPLSGGLLLRSLGAGLPVIAAGESAKPIGDWLAGCGAGTGALTSSAELAAAFDRVLERGVAHSPWRARARAAAAAHGPEALAARLAAAMASAGRAARAA